MSFLSAAAHSAASASPRTHVLTYLQQNLQRLGASSHADRTYTFYQQIAEKKPDFVFVQEVGETFSLEDGAPGEYKLIHTAVNKMQLDGGLSKPSQLNIMAFCRADCADRGIGIESAESLSIARANEKGTQRRQAISFVAKAGSKRIQFLVVHADASDTGGRAMLEHFDAQASKIDTFIGVGDVNVHVPILLESVHLVDPRRRISAALKADGSGEFEPTHVSGLAGQQKYKTFDFAYHGDRIDIVYEKPMFAQYPPRSSIFGRQSRSLEAANEGRTPPIDHASLFARVYLRTTSEMDALPSLRPSRVRYDASSGLGADTFDAAKAELRSVREAVGRKAILAKRESNKIAAATARLVAGTAAASASSKASDSNEMSDDELADDPAAGLSGASAAASAKPMFKSRAKPRPRRKALGTLTAAFSAPDSSVASGKDSMIEDE